MQDRIPVNPGRVLITPEDGSAAFYATMVRADNPTQEGTALNKANLLKDATAALFGLDTSAVPDDVLALIPDLIAGRAQVATGSYTGTGTAGSGNKNSITFDFEPKLVFVATAYTAQSTNYYQGYFVRGCATAYAFAGNFPSNHDPTAPYAAVLNVTWDGNGLTWYQKANSPNASAQMNAKYTYYYVAIG